MIFPEAALKVPTSLSIPLPFPFWRFDLPRVGPPLLFTAAFASGRISSGSGMAA
jgi:hypothetical protein